MIIKEIANTKLEKYTLMIMLSNCSSLIKCIIIFFFLSGILLAQSSLESLYNQGNKLRNQKSKEILQEMRESDFKVTYRKLYLRELIETGLRKNQDQLLRDYEAEILEINWDNAHDSFWYPRLRLNLTSGPHTVVDLKKWESIANSPGATIGFGFDDYTLFNWGIDYLSYLNSKNDYNRGKEKIVEARRKLRHDMIVAFFKLWSYKEIEKINKQKLMHAAHIYRLNKQRAALKKISLQEYYQSKGIYLKCQQEFREAKVQSEIIDAEISYLIDNPIGTRYILRENLKYRELHYKFLDVMHYALEKNPEILDAANELENKSRDYKKVLKENMPLPKFSFNLGGYTHPFGTGKKGLEYSTSTTSNNDSINMVATINATWTIWGEHGFLNKRKKELASINKKIAVSKIKKSKTYVSSLLRQYYRKVINYQEQIKILAASTHTYDKLLDHVFENYRNNKTTFINFKNALKELSESQIKLVQGKYGHLENKVYLAETMGLDDIPGKNFEELVTMGDDRL